MTLCLNCERSLEAGRHAIDSAERIVRNQAERIAAMKARIAELESLSPQPLREIPYDATARPIEEVLAELAAEVPREEWDKLPLCAYLTILNKGCRVEARADGRAATIRRQAERIAELEAEVAGLTAKIEAAKQLTAILDTITTDAKWCGLVQDGVAANVRLWHLPRCDGRKGTLLEAAEAAKGAPDA